MNYGNEYLFYIGGEFRKGRRRITVYDPAEEQEFATIFDAEQEDIEYALEKAKVAQKVWSKTPFKERAKILREISKTIFENLKVLAELESKEIGKPFKESLFVDVPLGAECFNYYASFLDSLEEKAIDSRLGIDILNYEPFGVCGVYLPYNVPLMIFGFSCAAALAAGNALVIKPSEYGSLSILELSKYLDKLDIPKGLVNIVTGYGETTGKYLAQSSIDVISFTGSRATLEKIIASSSSNPKKIVCELGGCNLAVIFSDADFDKALKNVLASSFIKSGQMCIGTSFVLIEESIFDSFLEEFVKKASSIKVGDPFDPTTGVGALPTKEILKQVHEKVQDLKRIGGKILCGGTPLEGKGYFYPPTIIKIDKVLYEELFAPVVMVKSFKKDEIEDIVERNPTGLVLQIWTKNLEKAYALAKRACVGTVWINTFAQLDSATPFGGMKGSGWGRNLGKFGFFEYVQIKHIGIGLRESPVEDWFGI